MAPYEGTRTRSPQKKKEEQAFQSRRSAALAPWGPRNADRITVTASDTGEGIRLEFPREGSIAWSDVAVAVRYPTPPRASSTVNQDSDNSSDRFQTPTPSQPLMAATAVQQAPKQIPQEAAIIEAASAGPSGGSRKANVSLPEEGSHDEQKATRRGAEEARRRIVELTNSQVEVSRQIECNRLTERNVKELEARFAALEEEKVAMEGWVAGLKGSELPEKESDCTISSLGAVVEAAGYDGSWTTSDLELMDEMDVDDLRTEVGSQASTARG